MDERMNKFRELCLRRNEARKLNHREVAEENRRNNLPSNWEARQRQAEWELQEIDNRKAAEERGEDYDRQKLLEVPAYVADKIDKSKKRKKNPDRGFSDYEAMTLRQYDQLTKQIKPDPVQYENMKIVMKEDFYPSSNTLIQGSHYPSGEAVDRLVDSVHKQMAKREKYHRRRTYDPDARIDFINERNRRFNKKLDRFYGQYTEEIKQNLERGTAV